MFDAKEFTERFDAGVLDASEFKDNSKNIITEFKILNKARFLCRGIALASEYDKIPSLKDVDDDRLEGFDEYEGYDEGNFISELQALLDREV